MRDSKQARLIGEYWNAVHLYLTTGETRDLQRFANRYVIDVRSARDGQEAWDLILAAPPGLLITDCTMPYLDGLSLCRRIRANRELCDLPIFLLTARGLELDPFVVSEQLGISKIILKPFSPRELLRDAQKVLGIVPVPLSATA